MMRRLFLLTALCAAAVSVFAGTSQAKVIRACKPNVQPGLEIVNKTNIIVFCGSAKATVKFGGKTYHLTNGACYPATGSLNIGIGKYTTTTERHAPFFTSLYLVVPASQDGTYKFGVVTVQFKGKSYSASKAKVVVKGNRSYGSFAGRFSKGPTFTGTFTCK